jgi:hypothetical protein
MNSGIGDAAFRHAMDFTKAVGPASWVSMHSDACGPIGPHLSMFHDLGGGEFMRTRVNSVGVFDIGIQGASPLRSFGDRDKLR